MFLPSHFSFALLNSIATGVEFAAELFRPLSPGPSENLPNFNPPH